MRWKGSLLSACVFVACLPATAAAGPVPSGWAIAGPTKEEGGTRARFVKPAIARTQPGSGRKIWRVATRTSWSGQEQVLLVLGSKVEQGRKWLKVLLPIRPNGKSGWVPRDHVALSHTPYWVKVRRGRRVVEVYRRGKRVKRFNAVVGKPSTPTPGGQAALYEHARQNSSRGFVGSWVLPLTVLSNVLQEYAGANGRVAIHGRGGASFQDPLGSAASHGCIRIDNGPVSWIATHVPPGAPVLIR